METTIDTQELNISLQNGVDVAHSDSSSDGLVVPPAINPELFHIEIPPHLENIHTPCDPVILNRISADLTQISADMRRGLVDYKIRSKDINQSSHDLSVESPDLSVESYDMRMGSPEIDMGSPDVGLSSSDLSHSESVHLTYTNINTGWSDNTADLDASDYISNSEPIEFGEHTLTTSPTHSQPEVLVNFHFSILDGSHLNDDAMISDEVVTNKHVSLKITGK